MIAVSDPEFGQVHDLTTASLLRYLRGRGWSPSRDYGRGQLWVLPVPDEPGEPYEVMVPLDRGPKDYADRVADLLETLSVVEARRPADVLREMSLPSADWQFLKLTPPGPSGTAPLVELVPALAGLRDLMTAAAAAEAAPEPQPVQPANKPQVVKDHVSSVRLDQTRVGSYVLAVHTPLPEAPAQDFLFDHDSREEPFARRVTRKLYAALICAREAADLSLREDELADFTRFAPGGLSANLCEALVKIGGEDGPGFSFDFAWSPDLPVEQPTHPIRLARPSSKLWTRSQGPAGAPGPTGHDIAGIGGAPAPRASSRPGCGHRGGVLRRPGRPQAAPRQDDPGPPRLRQGSRGPPQGRRGRCAGGPRGPGRGGRAAEHRGVHRPPDVRVKGRARTLALSDPARTLDRQGCSHPPGSSKDVDGGVRL